MFELGLHITLKLKALRFYFKQCMPLSPRSTQTTLSTDRSSTSNLSAPPLFCWMFASTATSISVSRTTLSPNEAAISSRDFCLVSLRELSVSKFLCELERERVDLREEEVCHNEEEERASYEDVEVVLVDIGKSSWASLGYCEVLVFDVGRRGAGVECVLATLTTKWKKEATPMTLFRRMMGTTSAP